MKKLILTLFGSIALCSVASVMAQETSYFTNPVIHGDMADPSILRIGDTFYATGTTGVKTKSAINKKHKNRAIRY